MCAEFRGQYSPTAALAGILTALLIILGVFTTFGQLSVDEFPNLAPTDFSSVSQDTRNAFRDEALLSRAVP
jgi:hypothetical protein